MAQSWIPRDSREFSASCPSAYTWCQMTGCWGHGHCSSECPLLYRVGGRKLYPFLGLVFLMSFWTCFLWYDFNRHSCAPTVSNHHNKCEAEKHLFYFYYKYFQVTTKPVTRWGRRSGMQFCLCSSVLLWGLTDGVTSWVLVRFSVCHDNDTLPTYPLLCRWSVKWTSLNALSTTLWLVVFSRKILDSFLSLPS